jgi:hypothetical protein
LTPATFESLALIPALLDALRQVGYTKPTEIQAGIIPHALEGRDVIGVAETVSVSISLAVSIHSITLLLRVPARPLRLHYRYYKNYGTSLEGCLRVCLRRRGTHIINFWCLIR